LDELFEAKRGRSSLKKLTGRVRPGSYPVYSASLRTPLTTIDSFDYVGPHLTWTTNGYAGHVQRCDGQFSVNADRGVLIARYPDLIDLEYAQLALEPVLRGMALGRIVDGKKNEYTKLSPERVAEALVDF